MTLQVTHGDIEQRVSVKICLVDIVAVVVAALLFQGAVTHTGQR